MGRVLPYDKIARTTPELGPQSVFLCSWLRSLSATANKQLMRVQRLVQEAGKERQLLHPGQYLATSVQNSTEWKYSSATM